MTTRLIRRILFLTAICCSAVSCLKGKGFDEETANNADRFSASVSPSVIAADGVLYSLFPGSGNWSVNVPRRAGVSLVSSRDGGRTWNDRRLIDPNRGAYSDLVALGSGRLGAAVEHGCLNSYDTISFIEIAVDPEDDAADAVPGTDEKQRK